MLAFILDTDASDTGMGAVLSQNDESGSERVLAYASKVVSRSEHGYSLARSGVTCSGISNISAAIC